ncbi:MAG: O-antigen ligase family protein [Patescibacteria group bacterium]
MNLQKILRACVIGILFLIPIFPLIVANSFFFPFITGKAFYFRILVELAFAGWAILAFLDAKYRPKITPLFWAVSIFALVTLVADLIGVNPLRSIWSNFERMEGWLVIIHLWAFFIVSTHVFGPDAEGRRWWYRWFNMSLAVAVVVGIYGIVQLAGGAAIHQGSTRIDASLGNAAYMAVYMLIHSFLAAYLFFVVRIKKVSSTVFLQWVYAILAVVFAFLIFETATRGTILALIGGILLSLGLYALLAKNDSKGRWISVGIIALMFVVGGVFWANRDRDFVKNSEVLSRLASISLSESKTQARGYIWPMALTGFKERPILGWGQENFNYIFNANYNPQMWNQEQWFDRAHNVYLDWLTASGIIGLIAYLALYVLAFVGIWKSALSLKEKSVLTGLIAAYAVHNIFVFDNLASYALFFAILGFASSLFKPRNMKSLGTAPVRLDAVEYVVAPVVLVLLVLGIYFLNARPIQANTELIASLQACNSGQPDVAKFQTALGYNQYMANQEIREQVLACSAGVFNGQFPGPLKQSFATLATQEIDNQIAASPKDARSYTLGGSFYNSVREFPKATELLKKAAELSPGKQSILLQLVNAEVAQNQLLEATALLKSMYETTPNHPDVRSAYARILILGDKEAEARKEFANDPSLFENDFVVQVYVQQKKYPQAITLIKKLIAADPKNANYRAGLAQIQALAGSKWEALQTLDAMQKDFPEYKSQIEEMIKEVQK